MTIELTPELVEPTELPTEPGWYLTGSETTVVWIDEVSIASGDPARLTPLTRLVPEKPPITAEELGNLLGWANSTGASITLADYINNR